MKTRLLLLASIACLVLAGLPASATVWDVSSAFSDTTNPNGQWSYNYWAPGVTLLATGGAYQGDVNVGGWSIDAANPTPYILHTRTGSEYVMGTAGTAGAVHFLPNEVTMKSNGGYWSVVRFTIPVTGNYYYKWNYTGREEGGATSVAAYAPAYGSWGGYVEYGQTAGFDASPGTIPSLIAFTAGDYMDLYIEGSAIGLSGYFTDDPTMIPEPSALLALLSGFIGTASLALRRRRS